MSHPAPVLLALGRFRGRRHVTGFRTCLPRGCIAVSDIDAEAVTALAAGDQAVVAMTDTNDQPININVSLIGFTAAWNRLKAL